jgi:hypothetical protein
MEPGEHENTQTRESEPILRYLNKMMMMMVKKKKIMTEANAMTIEFSIRHNNMK